MENSEKFFWGGSIASHQCDGAYDQDGKGPGIMDYVTASSVQNQESFTISVGMVLFILLIMALTFTIDIKKT